MAITDHIANYGKNVGAGLLAGAQNQYAIQQNQQQNDRNAFVQDRRFNANQQRNQRLDQRQATAEQMAFGQDTLKILSGLPPEQRKQAYIARTQEAAQTIGLPEGFDPEQGWAQIQSQLPPFASGGPDAPSSVREWEHYNTLSKEEQGNYLNMKRSGNRFDVGDQPFYREPGGVTTPLATQPEVSANITASEQAKVLGREAGQKAADWTTTEAKYHSMDAQWTTLESALDTAISDVSAVTAGPVGAGGSGVWGSPQYDYAEVLKTIKANIGFDRLQQMRDASPTGGALGQVSEMENKLLQATQGSLEQGQSPARLKSNLLSILRNLKALRAQKQKAYLADKSKYGEAEETKIGGATVVWD